MGTTFASFHAGGKCDDVRSMLKYVDRGSESSPAPSRSTRGLNKSGPHALDGSIKDMASRISLEVITIEESVCWGRTSGGNT